MKNRNFPIFTVIMRHYTLEQALLVTEVLSEFEGKFAVEVTLNTENAYKIISQLQNSFGKKVQVGAGTVRNLEEAQKSVEAGATFLLGPHTFTEEIFDFCKAKNIIAVPSAMTPSEINKMINLGADIVKVFPASVVGATFFKDVQAPLGKLPLMAVGGVSYENASDFLKHDVTYLGMGSAMFSKDTLAHLNTNEIKAICEKYLKLIN
ncbi:2-dehydro-3-deoxyphosphogluconate aldolase/(4S)-4-hydroxy-2-oxoglutarate aldolase [Enterococcus sp. PF1-24]|uniref:bifunctional 4-hydroxy-2-oxoglutarate aldolase/2-dehydro-3-deoxy-phosphogluconate aldolase n=1 Tax=unclassified Enterococcus TaxID=2608891 RepID=UPI00247304BE|nr:MULTISPECIES: bifunctional 4-hydroxy-2-oxoglutarate aldolase/2-dehydro-3-deoxy-phosphogluconate aldolase [unclassified Enterococcus]MDH6364999.1 2-dehydro-3-deoxyphosphogluconate aldolase/(4S)-4-hydroxy-2-oxoglutarate aldolase [Enterococcus sp. PFB1-1]MDH6402100.1 2-dehydro-3-deoxyphosphogluconate aldolase/(4S)-4-hydroxy-2-oxoglutarate aldolase [Enterococcus sp. PF1-24]